MLLGIGWIPVILVDRAEYLWPYIDKHYSLTSFGLIWFWDIGLPSLGLTAISVLIQIVRLAQWEMAQSGPKE